jgi:hypothetical protein
MITRVAFTLLLLTASAQAAEITILSKTPAFVLVDGQINPTDNDKFIKAVDGLRNATIYLSSPGSHLRAGVMIGVGEGDRALGRICAVALSEGMVMAAATPRFMRGYAVCR